MESSPGSDRRLELLLQQLEDLPTLPAVAVRVLDATGSDDSSLGNVVALIVADQSLTARILSLVNRADIGAGQVSSVERAISLLGFDAVRGAVLAVSVFQAFATDKTAGPFNRAEFWKHSLAVACCAELLAGELPNHTEAISPADAFVCGLLHDIGKVALDTVLPKSYSRVVEGVDLLRGDIADIERTVIGLDHHVVGKRLAERWQLPGSVRDCIWLHGQIPAALPATVSHPRLVNLVSLADLLAREQHLGYSGNYTTTPRPLFAEALHLSADQIDGTLKRLIGQMEPRFALLGLGQASGPELYHQAIARANQELGQLSQQLASRNRRLATRAKFFEAMSNFQGELRPDAPTHLVLQAIAQTGSAALDVPVLVAFSLPPGQTFATVTIARRDGVIVDSSLVDCPHRPNRPTAGDGPVLPTGQSLESLLTVISPRLTGPNRFWICLESDGQCVGGVVWGSIDGEAQRLSNQAQELTALSHGWSLALRTAQIREESRNLSEQLAEANRRLQGAQTELLHSKMIAAVGEMAAGAAHEMNNPLAVISGRSQLLAAQLTDPKLKHAANLIHQQSHRLSEIITELMEFARPEAPHRTQVDVADLVARALHDAKALTEPADTSGSTEAATIEVTVTDIPLVKVDEQQVSAALTEIIANAMQATEPTIGRIEIHAAVDSLGNQVVLSISDNGSGMDAETLKRAFDPFFSAKPAGRRRGMGLAKALRWVESSGGSIRLESRPGQGTRSIILLPAVTATPALMEVPQDQTHGRKLAQ